MKRFLYAALIPAVAFSQDLQELMDLAIKNRLVQASIQDVEALKQEYESVISGYKPKIDVNARYANSTRETNSTAKNSASASASLNYILFDGLRKYRVYDGYKASINSSEKSLEALKNQISLDVTNFYFNYQSFISAKEAKQKEIEQLKSQYERLNNFYKVGNVTLDQLEKIQSRVEAANVELHQIELNIQTVLHNLEYIVGTPVQIDQGSVYEDITNIKKENLRYDIQALEFDTQRLLFDAEVEKSAYLPTITLDNTYTKYDNDFNDPIYSRGLKEQNTISANLSWNIFAFGQTKNIYESRYKTYLGATSRYEYEKNRANIDLQLAKKSYNISKLQLDSAQSSLKAAITTYEIVKTQYENGLVDNVAFLESLSERYNAQSILEASKNTLEIRKAEIIFHSGKNLIGFIK